MRKFAVLTGATAVALAVAVAPAMGQTPVTEFTSKAQVFPKKAGTKKNPQGVTIKGSLAFKTITQGVEPPIITGGTVYFPKHGKYNGGKYATCSQRTMKRDDSVKNCPKKSIMGSGKGSALADTVDARPTVTFVNGGSKRVWAFTTLYNPALVQEPIAINIKKLRHPKWGYSATFRVPKVLQVVAGVPVSLTSFNYSVGGKSYAKDYIVTTGCPKSKKYPYQATANYLYNDNTTSKDTYKGTTPCR
jgi:hypothetical protein